MPGHWDGVGCHGVSFHVCTDAGTSVLGLINAGTLTGSPGPMPMTVCETTLGVKLLILLV